MGPDLSRVREKVKQINAGRKEAWSGSSGNYMVR